VAFFLLPLLLHTFATIKLLVLQYAGRRAPDHACSVGSSKSVTAPEMAPTATRLPLPAMALPRRSIGSHSRTRPVSCTQLSQPESERVTSNSDELAMHVVLEGDSVEEMISPQTTVLLISRMSYEFN
jgi:hypothetical protein